MRLAILNLPKLFLVLLLLLFLCFFVFLFFHYVHHTFVPSSHKDTSRILEYRLIRYLTDHSNYIGQVGETYFAMSVIRTPLEQVGGRGVWYVIFTTPCN